MNIAYRAPAIDRRLGLLLTILVHAALVIGWQAARKSPATPIADDSVRTRVLWIPLRPPQPAAPRTETPAPPHKETPDIAPPRPHARPGPAITLPPLPQAATPAPANDTAPAPTPAAGTAAAPAEAAAAKPSAEQILQQARRDIGKIDKALRKENNPYIAAPLDSPQMRMRRGMEEAHALAPPRLWEAPKVEELVNNTGDGARRTRVITGRRTYCVTERATNTDVEMIEHHGKLRITNCPTPEAPATKQAWRTLRD
jgi:type IV secretory pathway VirB10-like protein